MTWPKACANCRSLDIQAAVHEVLCLVCGRLTDALGHVIPLHVQFTSDDYRTEVKK